MTKDCGTPIRFQVPLLGLSIFFFTVQTYQLILVEISNSVIHELGVVHRPEIYSIVHLVPFEINVQD